MSTSSWIRSVALVVCVALLAVALVEAQNPGGQPDCENECGQYLYWAYDYDANNAVDICEKYTKGNCQDSSGGFACCAGAGLCMSDKICDATTDVCDYNFCDSCFPYCAPGAAMDCYAIKATGVTGCDSFPNMEDITVYRCKDSTPPK